MSLRRPAVAVLLIGLGACGGDGSTDPAPLPSPAAALVAPRNMRLLSQVDLAALGATSEGGAQAVLASSAAGNWGYTSPEGRRFALTGVSSGLSIVEVTDPARPKNLGTIVGGESLWREVKTYGEHVYVTTEARTGLDIISMRDPDNPVKVRTWNETFSSAHTLWIDTESGLLFVNGTRDVAGRSTGVRILSLEADPENPREVGSFTGFYVHDSYLRGSLLFASAISDGFLGVLDVSDPARVREVTRFFTGGRFTHNSWLTGDGRYLFTTDENREGRPLEGWDLSVLTSPRKVSEYQGAAGTVPHNVLIDGQRLLVAHYTEGVHLLDIRNPERPQLLGSYDTHSGAAGGYAGVWGAYVFPGSNLILASDMQGGLFVIEYTGP